MIKKLTSIIVTCVLGLSSLNLAPAMAASDPATTVAVATGSSPVTTLGAKAAILTGCAEDEEDGIGCILRLVIDIMTIGIGIFGVIGITICGIQYLTAGGSEEQTRKAKRRLFEIIIGLVVYAAGYLILRFLLPGFME